MRRRRRRIAAVGVWRREECATGGGDARRWRRRRRGPQEKERLGEPKRRRRVHAGHVDDVPPGTYTWADGDKYVGQYKDGKEHGLGRFTFASGKVMHDGEWVNGEPKK